MRTTLNSTIDFSGVDLTGAAAAVCTYTGPTGLTSAQAEYFTPMVKLESLNAAAADFVFEIWFKNAKGTYYRFYTSGAITKDPDSSTVWVWQYPHGPIPLFQSANNVVDIRVSSTNGSDSSIDGQCWLLNAKANSPYLFETTVEGVTNASQFSLVSVNDFQETNDWYINRTLEVEDAGTGTSAKRRVIDQIGDVLYFESDFPFLPAGGDAVRMLISDYGDIGTANGNSLMTTGDIKDAMEAEGGMLESIDTLTTAAGDGDLAAVYALMKANGDGDLAAIRTAVKILSNKAVQNKLTGKIDYYDDDGETIILTITPIGSSSEIIRAPS